MSLKLQVMFLITRQMWEGLGRLPYKMASRWDLKMVGKMKQEGIEQVISKMGKTSPQGWSDAVQWEGSLPVTQFVEM